MLPRGVNQFRTIKDEASVGKVVGELSRFIKKTAVIRLVTGKDDYVSLIASKAANYFD